MLAEEPEPKDMTSRKTGATFKQLVDGNRVHFCDGQSARSSEPAGPRTGVPLLFVISFFCLAFPLMVSYSIAVFTILVSESLFPNYLT